MTGPSAVTPTELNPAYDITLTDGTDTLGLVIVGNDGVRVDEKKLAGAIQRQGLTRTALKTAAGGSAYSDLELPYMSLDQDDWSGGRGSDDYEKDRTRFYDNYRCQITSGGIILGGVETYATNIKGQEVANVSPASMQWKGLKKFGSSESGYEYRATSFVATLSSVKYVEMWIKYNASIQQGNNPILCQIWTDSSGSPGTLVTNASDQVEMAVLNTYEELKGVGLPTNFRFTFDTAATLTPTNTYWLVLRSYPLGGGGSAIWEVGCLTNGGITSKTLDTGGSWTASSDDLWFRITGADTDANAQFFEYKGAMYCVTTPDSGADSTLWLNGDRGVADSNSGDKTYLNDASKSWTADEWIGCIAYITSGAGAEEAQPWRNITDNDATTLTVSPDWNVAHDTTTEYIILKSNKWTNVLDVAGYCTDVAVAGEFVYFARGDIGVDNVLRYQWYQTGGAAATRSEAENEQANKLLAIRHPEENVYIMYGSRERHEVYGTCLWKAWVPPAWGKLYTDLGEIQTTDAPWLYSAPPANVTVVINGEDTELTIADAATTGRLIIFDLGTSAKANITNGSALAVLCKSSVDAAATPTLKLQLDTDSAFGSAVDYNMPALSAGVWTWATIDIADITNSTSVTDYTAVQYGAFNMAVDLGAFTFKMRGGLRLISTAYRYVDLPNDMRINRLVAFSGNADDPRENPWIITEGRIYEVQTQNSDIIVPLPIKEMATLKSNVTGEGAIPNDVYLFFTLGRKVERLFGRNLDDIGPDRDEGLPALRQGDPAFLLSYPGQVIYGIDAGGTGFSSVLALNGEAWHELYRAPYGDRIRGGGIQTIPGSTTQRLWIYRNGGLLWIPVSPNPVNDPDFQYIHEGVLEGAWFYSTMRGILKAWKSLTLFLDNISAGNQEVYAGYEISTASSAGWVAISTAYDTEPFEEQNLATTAPTSYRIKYRVKLRTNDSTETPKVVAAVFDAYGIVPIKHGYTFLVSLADDVNNKDLEGADIIPFGYNSAVETAIAKLDGWADALTQLTMGCRFSPYDGKSVIMTDPILVPLSIDSQNQVEAYLIQVTVHDI